MEQEYVFIVGCPRTGSTLLRHLLNKSENICITSETHYLRRLSKIGLWKRITRFGDMNNTDNVDKLIAYLYSGHYASARGYWGWLNKHIDRQQFRQRLLATDRSDCEIFRLLMQIYMENKKSSSDATIILGEKTPTHLYYVPTLFEWFPNTKIIHTFRDPRAIFTSVLKRVKTGKWGPKALFPSLPAWMIDPWIDPIEVFHVTKMWLDAVRLHTKYEHLYPNNYYLLRFEDLVNEPEQQLQQVCRFLNIPFESRMLDSIDIVGSSFQQQRRVFTGLDKTATHRWQEHIHPLARAWFSILGGKYLKQFGYEV